MSAVVSKPMRIYIAGPLSSRENISRNPSQVVVDYIQNIHRMCQAASQVRKKGHAPFIPAADILVGAIAGNWTEEDYRGMSNEFLDVCDAVLVIGYNPSVEGELYRFGARPVYYNINDIPESRKEITNE